MGIHIEGKPLSQYPGGAVTALKSRTIRRRDADKLRRRLRSAEAKAARRALKGSQSRPVSGQHRAPEPTPTLTPAPRPTLLPEGVSCPRCGAPSGAPCKTDKGARAKNPHKDRQVKAARYSQG